MKSNVVIFHHGILSSGGSERITLEEEKYFNNMEINTTIVTFYYNPKVFNGSYSPDIVNISPKRYSKFLFIKIFQKINNLRKFIKDINPDHVITVGEEGCVYLYFATLFTKYSYSAHIPQTIFWNIQTYKNVWDTSAFLLGRYSSVFRKVYNEIRDSAFGHKESLPEKPPKMSIQKKILSEILGFITFKGVRKAKNVFVLSNKMAWEIEKMYKRKAVVLKGAYPKSIKNYVPKTNIKNYYNISDKKIILSLCRLEPKKRVDLIVESFHKLVQERKNVVLIVGGTGSTEKDLKNLVNKLKIKDSVIFTGFIDDNMLYDYYHCCDVFVSADHADYDITTYMALGFNKKVVWSIENETDNELEKSNMVFPTNINPSDFSRAIECALDSNVNGNFDAGSYSWKNYFSNIYKYL